MFFPPNFTLPKHWVIDFRQVQINSFIAKCNLMNVEELNRSLIAKKVVINNQLNPINNQIINHIQNAILEHYVAMMNVLIKIQLINQCPKILDNQNLMRNFHSVELKYSNLDVNKKDLILEGQYGNFDYKQLPIINNENSVKPNGIIYNDYIRLNVNSTELINVYHAGMFSVALFLLGISANSSLRKHHSFMQFNEEYCKNWHLSDFLNSFIKQFLIEAECYSELLSINVDINEYGKIGVIHLLSEYCVYWNGILSLHDKMFEILEHAKKKILFIESIMTI